MRFDNGSGTTLVGDLYRPASHDGPLRALVVTGSWLTVKEQMAGGYARRLAERGFAALAFDYTGWGQSAGEVRDVENPARKTLDINAAVGFLAGHPAVDSGRIGAVGICASSMYTAANAAGDQRVRSIGFVAPWLHDPVRLLPYYGGERGIADRLAAAGRAQRRFDDGLGVDYLPAISETDENAAMYGPYDYYLDPARGAIPEWSARFAVLAWHDWLTYDAMPTADKIEVPALGVHSRTGAVPDGAEEFFSRLAGPSELVWTSGGQLDFYDQPAQVAFSLDQLTGHFTATL